MGFSKQQCWSGLPFPFSGDIPNSGIEPTSPALQTDSLLTELPGKAYIKYNGAKSYETVLFTTYVKEIFLPKLLFAKELDKNTSSGNFPFCQVKKTPHSQYMGSTFNPWSGN